MPIGLVRVEQGQLTTDDLIIALRLGNTAEERAIAERLLGAAQEVVNREAPSAPDVLKDEAVIRLAAYWYDQPNAGRGTAYAGAFRNSGAKSILLPYRKIKVFVAG